MTSLNQVEHQYGEYPTKIVWLQVEGLNDDHLALIKYVSQSENKTTHFEKSTCIGKIWNYNLYDIRPNAHLSFLSQVTGRKNYKGTCSDYKFKPLWSYFAGRGQKVAILEDAYTGKKSFLSQKCPQESKSFLQDAVHLRMAKVSNENSPFFHRDKIDALQAGQTYFDRSCQSGKCFSTFKENSISLFEKFVTSGKSSLFIMRNFSYAHYLSSKNYKLAQKELLELDQLVGYFQEKANGREDILFLVTSANGQKIHFPPQGKSWSQLVGKRSPLKTSKALMSSVFVSGASSENFCGVAEHSEVLRRIYAGSKKDLEYMFLIPL